jgi:peptide/nickel transport system permease protein
MPGDPVSLMLRDPRLPEDVKQTVRVMFGLDKPMYVQFFTYIGDVFAGRLGYSFVYRTPVADLLWSRVQNTIPLVLGGNLLAIGIGVLAGVITAWKRGSRIDSVGQTIVLSLYSIPYFWFGMSTLMVLIMFLGANVPVGGMGISGMVYASFYDQLADYLRHLTIPMLVYALGATGAYGLIVRNVMVEVLSEDFIVTARAKGLKERTIMFGTALRNASLPLITLVALNLGFVVGGAIEIETVFSWPGLGLLVYRSVLARDYPVLQGAFLLLTMSVVIANLFADILYFYLDPRVRQ